MNVWRRNLPMRSVLRRSAAIASATPGYCTLTATARSAPVSGSRDHCPMNLADRRRGDRIGVPLDEDLLRRRTEFFGDHLGGELALIGGAFACSSASALAHRLGQAVVEVAGHLPDLHQRALHLAEALGDVLGGTQLALRRRSRRVARRRSEQLAGRCRGIRRPDVEADAGQLQVAGGARTSARSGRAAPVGYGDAERRT